MIVRGRLEHRDLEGGIWQLVADDGTRFTLLGAPGDLRSGAYIEVDGVIDDGFGIAMSGPQLRVKRIRKL